MPALKPKIVGAILVLSLILAAGVACSIDNGNSQGDEEKEEYIPVEVETVEEGEINLTSLISGSVKSQGEVPVVARLGGEVEEIHVSLGDRVNKGDLLLSLSAPDVSLQARQARDTLKSLREGRDELEDLIDEIDELMEETTATQEIETIPTQEAPTDEDKEENTKNDDQKNTGAAEDRDDENTNSNGTGAETNGNGDESDTDSDWENPFTEGDIDRLRELLENQFDPAATLRQQLMSLEAQIKQAQWGVEMAELATSNLSVTAPIAGKVSLVNSTVGASVGPGSVLLMLSGDQGFKVEAQVMERLVTLVQPGDTVGIYLPILEQEFQGTVAEVSPAPLPNTRFYQMGVTFEPTERVLPGMFARLSLITESTGETLVIPRSALLKRGEKDVVFVNAEGRAVRREVTLGVKDKDRVEVLSGLKRGESLVVRGQHYLEEGTLLKISPELSPSEGEGN